MLPRQKGIWVWSSGDASEGRPTRGRSPGAGSAAHGRTVMNPKTGGLDTGGCRCWFSRSVVSDSRAPVDGSLPGPSVRGTLQAGGLGRAAVAFSRDSPGRRTGTGCRRLLQGLSRQEDWGGLPSPSPGGLLGPGMERASPPLRAGSLQPESAGEPQREETRA